MLDSFSQRHRLAWPPAGTLLRDHVPASFRAFLLNDLLHVDVFDLQKVVSRALDVFPQAPNFHCGQLVANCKWFFIYDIIEGLYKRVYEKNCHSNPGAITAFTLQVNKELVEENMGWQLLNGQVIASGDEAFENAVKDAVSLLERNDRPTAAAHIQDATRALSSRPRSNTSGAVAHATSAVECVLGAITGDALTLGKYLDRHPGLFHPALKKALDGIYGYASDEGARHGKEGSTPAQEEAEFVVATCAAACTLLTKKRPK